MNWNEIQDFIDTLTPEQKQYEVLIIDNANDVALEILSADITDEVTYCTYNGIIGQSLTEDYIEEELTDLEDNTYIKIDSEVPYLNAE